MTILCLRQVFCGQKGGVYHSGTDICWQDLEKNNRTQALFVVGRNIHDLATKGSHCYKKALVFLFDKWWDKLMQPKESGWSVKDVIENVRNTTILLV